MEIKCRNCWANHTPGSPPTFCGCLCHQSGGIEELEKKVAEIVSEENGGEKKEATISDVLLAELDKTPDWEERFEKLFPKNGGWIKCAVEECGDEMCGWVAVRDFIERELKEAEDRGYVSRGIVEAKIKDGMIRHSAESYKNGIEKARLQAYEEIEKFVEGEIRREKKSKVPEVLEVQKEAHIQLLEDTILPFVKENKTK